MDEKQISPTNTHAESPSVIGGKTGDASTKEVVTNIKVGAVAVWATCAKLTKQGVDAYKARAARIKAERAEAIRVKTLLAFQEAKEKVEGSSRFIAPENRAYFAQADAAFGGNDERIARFLDHELTKKFFARVDQRRAFYDGDRKRQQNNFIHSTNTSNFFRSLDQASADQILKVVSGKYMRSTGGGTLAASILAGRSNYGGAALVAADVLEVKQRNGLAKAMFTKVIKNLRYDYSATGMVPEVQQGIVTATRLLNFGEGDEIQLNKILFSLIYYNGNATPFPPQPYNEFSASLHPAFHNNFRSFIPTVYHALADLDQIVNQTAYRQKLANAADLTAFFQTFKLELPALETL